MKIASNTAILAIFYDGENSFPLKRTPLGCGMCILHAQDTHFIATATLPSRLVIPEISVTKRPLCYLCTYYRVPPLKARSNALLRSNQAKDRVTTELREGSKILEDQLRLMDEKVTAPTNRVLHLIGWTYFLCASRTGAFRLDIVTYNGVHHRYPFSSFHPNQALFVNGRMMPQVPRSFRWDL